MHGFKLYFQWRQHSCMCEMKGTPVQEGLLQKGKENSAPMSLLFGAARNQWRKVPKSA